MTTYTSQDSQPHNQHPFLPCFRHGFPAFTAAFSTHLPKALPCVDRVAIVGKQPWHGPLGIRLPSSIGNLIYADTEEAVLPIDALLNLLGHPPPARRLGPDEDYRDSRPLEGTVDRLLDRGITPALYLLPHRGVVPTSPCPGIHDSYAADVRRTPYVSRVVKTEESPSSSHPPSAPVGATPCTDASSSWEQTFAGGRSGRRSAPRLASPRGALIRGSALTP
jgi:hypothetical protein